jgi:hypothetical protein
VVEERKQKQKPMEFEPVLGYGATVRVAFMLGWKRQ